MSVLRPIIHYWNPTIQTGEWITHVLEIANTRYQYWIVPADWNNSANKIEVIGGGGGGSARNAGGGGAAGAGGGEYRILTNHSLTPGANVPLQLLGVVGASANGNNVWFQSTETLLAVGGKTNGTNATVGAPGGSGGVGGAGFPGGAGADISGTDSGGGGGAGGPTGAGVNASAMNGGAGSAGDGGAGGGAGAQAGSPGFQWTDSISGIVAGAGGGGGGRNNAGAGGAGGLYGGGGAGAWRTSGVPLGGAGQQGLIVISYKSTGVVGDPAVRYLAGGPAIRIFRSPNTRLWRFGLHSKGYIVIAGNWDGRVSDNWDLKLGNWLVNGTWEDFEFYSFAYAGAIVYFGGAANGQWRPLPGPNDIIGFGVNGGVAGGSLECRIRNKHTGVTLAQWDVIFT